MEARGTTWFRCATRGAASIAGRYSPAGCRTTGRGHASGVGTLGTMSAFCGPIGRTPRITTVQTCQCRQSRQFPWLQLECWNCPVRIAGKCRDRPSFSISVGGAQFLKDIQVRLCYVWSTLFLFHYTGVVECMRSQSLVSPWAGQWGVVPTSGGDFTVRLDSEDYSRPAPHGSLA